MPLLKAMVLEDLELADASARQVKKLEMERFATGRRDEEGAGLGREQRLDEAPTLPELTEGAEVKAEEKKAARRAEDGEPSEAADAVEEIAAIEAGQQPATDSAETPAANVEAEPLDFPVALSRITALLSTPRASTDSPSTETPLSGPDAAAQLSHLYRSFAFASSPSTTPSHLSLTLRFLLHLCAPPSPSPSAPAAKAPHLPLALLVLQDLLAFLPDSVVAPTPSPFAAVKRPAALQSVLLRTVVNIALAEPDSPSEGAGEGKEGVEFAPIAAQAVLALEKLRAANPGLASDAAEDLARLVETLSALLNRMSDERVFAYQPSKLPSAAAGPDGQLNLAAELLLLRQRWAPQEQLSREVENALDAFADEAAERYRWDALARVWEAYGAGSDGGKWALKQHHLKLLRWLAGEAPFSTYPSSPAPSSSSPSPVSPRSLRPVRATLFASLAETTHLSLRDPASPSSPRWTLEDKNAYLSLLLSSGASSRQTRSLARRAVALWQLQSPPSLPAPFICRSDVLLSLVRTALPPWGNSPAYAQRLLATHVSLLVSPSSPYARARGGAGVVEFDHFDLTTLAFAYGLLRDWGSVAQIYRKMLDQRVLPDAKDVELILGTAPRRFAPGAVGLVKQAAGVGVGVGEEIWTEVLRGALEEEVKTRREANEVPGTQASEKQQQDRAARVVREVCDAAKTLGLDGAAVKRLQAFAADFLALRPSASSSSSTSPSLPPPFSLGTSHATSLEALRSLSASATASPYKASTLFARALSIFRTAAPSLPDSPALLVPVLRVGLAALERGEKDKKEDVKAGLRDVVDAALPYTGSGSGRGMIRTREAVDLLLRVLVRVGDVPAIDRVFARLKAANDSVEPGEEEVVKAVRWAVSQEGRAKVLGGQGWVSERAREVLKAKKKARSKGEKHEE
ncbi:hypothetical protein JCM10213v2_008736 [Rhodosporidiobolus nylandii]